MRIAICDDELQILKQLKNRIEKILSDNGLNAEVITFLSGEELLKNIEKIDFLFLDIEMPKMDGIEVGKYLQKEGSACKIVMESSRVERFKDTFKINAFRFITKPFDNQEIEEALQTFFHQQIGTNMMQVYRNRIPYDFKQREIEYVCAYNGYTKFSINETIFRKECSLNAVEIMLDHHCFIRINKQYCVNMFFIKSYENGYIKIGGKELLVSRRKRKEFEKIFLEFGINYI